MTTCLSCAELACALAKELKTGGARVAELEAERPLLLTAQKALTAAMAYIRATSRAVDGSAEDRLMANRADDELRAAHGEYRAALAEPKEEQ